MGHVVGNAEFRHFFDELTRLNFQLPREFIDSDLARIQKYLYLPAARAIIATQDSPTTPKAFPTDLRAPDSPTGQTPAE